MKRGVGSVGRNYGNFNFGAIAGELGLSREAALEFGLGTQLLFGSPSAARSLLNGHLPPEAYFTLDPDKVNNIENGWSYYNSGQWERTPCR